MFQIETALLKFGEMSGSQNDKTIVVKRCAFCVCAPAFVVESALDCSTAKCGNGLQSLT
jgi:hypothetical protein